MDEHFEGDRLSQTSGLKEDDSLLDFKSPKQSSRQKSIEFNHCNGQNQKKRTVAKLKNFVKSHKGEKKNKESEKKRNVQESQPSIESSFFKTKANCYDTDSTTDAKLALVCPLCFKTFKDVNSHVLHMKTCAYKNNVSTKKLLNAIELQKRQENERKSLGLPVAPMLQAKKKPSNKNLYEETDVQLALVLSKSEAEYQEAEELDEISENLLLMNEIESLPKILNQFASETNKSVQAGQLEKFGFANDKPASVIRNKKKILMGNEITQNQDGKIKCNRNFIQKKNDLKSRFLQKFCNKEEKLWSKAKLSSNQKYFYVSNLSNYITSREKQVNQEIILDFANTCEIYDMKLSQCKETRICNNKERDKVSHTEARFINEKCEKYQNIQSIDTMITNWGNALNDSSASDIIIFVNNNKHIWAHKLIFYVQCPNILLDVTPNDTLLFTKIKEKISWTDTSYNIALAFLEFIYCGIIKKYLNVLDDLINFSFLRNLAKRYKIKELFVLLKKKEIEIKQIRMHGKWDRELISEEEDNLEAIDNNVENLIHGIKDSKSTDDEKLNKKHLDKDTDKSQLTETELRKDTCTDELLQEEINYFNDANIIRNNNTSPDLFDDVNDTKQIEEIKNKTMKYINETVDGKKAKNNENSNIIDSANDQATIDTTKFSTSGCSMTKLKNIEKDKNLFTDNTHFTTPRKGDCSNILKLKSNLSIFIEQVQKENARSNSDLDSDVSILSTCSKLCKNPFNIKQDDSFENNIVKETFKTKSDILDIFDRNENSELKTKMNSCEKNDSDISLNFESINMPSSESNERECATKEVSANKSINNAYLENLQDEAIHSTSEESLSSENKNDIPSDFNTFSDEDEISMYSTYKKGHKNNSIVKYRNFVHKHIMKSNATDNVIYDEYQNKNKMDDDSLLLNIDKDSIYETSPTRKHDNEDEVIPNFEESKKISQQSLCNFAENEYVTSEEYNHSFTNVKSSSSQKNIFKDQKFNNSDKLKYSKSESNINLQTIKNKSGTDEPNNSVETSILVSSSPELGNNILYAHKHEENEKSTSSLHYQNSENSNSHNSENDIYLANAYINDSDDNIDTLSFTEQVNQSEFKDNEKSSSKKKYNRKFKRKSLLETNLHIGTRHIKEDIVESYNNSHCRCDYKKNLKATVLPEIIEDSVTPPPNYNGMRASQLQAELNKYGLKQIQKRKRAVKLLTYIYNELHPTINTKSPRNIKSKLVTVTTSSEDDEPPMKKRNSKKNDIDLIDNGSNIKDMFLKLLSIKTELYNQILAYEPICINSLHHMLKTEGLKCKMNILMDFLDEQCITFYVQEAK